MKKVCFDGVNVQHWPLAKGVRVNHVLIWPNLVTKISKELCTRKQEDEYQESEPFSYLLDIMNEGLGLQFSYCP